MRWTGFPADMGQGENTKYDTDAIKSRLTEYREREKDIEYQSERLDRIETKLISVGSPTFSDMPKSPNQSNDRIVNMIAQKEELKSELDALLKKQKDERKEINAILKRLKHSDEKAVIQMRYLDGASWNEVVDMLFGGKEDFLGKEDTYLRRIHKIHGYALLNMAIIAQKGK